MEKDCVRYSPVESQALARHCPEHSKAKLQYSPYLLNQGVAPLDQCAVKSM